MEKKRKKRKKKTAVEMILFFDYSLFLLFRGPVGDFPLCLVSHCQQWRACLLISFAYLSAKERQTDRQTEIDRQAGRQTDRQSDRQT